MLDEYRKAKMFNNMLDLFNGYTIREVAKMSGVGKSTVHKYLHEPEFKSFCVLNGYNEVDKLIELNMKNHIHTGRVLGGMYSHMHYY